MRRTQLLLEEAQYYWLKARARQRGGIAGVVRGLIDAARARQPDASRDPLIRYLLVEPAAEGKQWTTVETLDGEVYGP